MIIPRNQSLPVPLPYSCTIRIQANTAATTAAVVHLYEGDYPNLKDNLHLVKFPVVGLVPGLDGSAPELSITFELDVSKSFALRAFQDNAIAGLARATVESIGCSPFSDTDLVRMTMETLTYRKLEDKEEQRCMKYTKLEEYVYALKGAADVLLQRVKNTEEWLEAHPAASTEELDLKKMDLCRDISHLMENL